MWAEFEAHVGRAQSGRQLCDKNVEAIEGSFSGRKEWTNLRNWDLAVEGSPTIHTLMSPRRRIPSEVVLWTPLSNISKIPLFTSEWPKVAGAIDSVNYVKYIQQMNQIMCNLWQSVIHFIRTKKTYLAVEIWHCLHHSDFFLFFFSEFHRNFLCRFWIVHTRGSARSYTE